MTAAIDTGLLGLVLPAFPRDALAIIAALLAAGALVARGPALRWTCAIAALVAAPALLAAAVLSDQAETTLDLSVSPLFVVAGAGIAIIVVLVVAAVIARWPALLPTLVAVVVPLRLPIDPGGGAVNLLLPLYGLILSAALAFAWRARRRGRAQAAALDLRSTGTGALPATATGRGAGSRDRLTGAARLVPILLAASVVLYGVLVPLSEDPVRGAETLAFFFVPFAVLFACLREVEWTGRVLASTAVAVVLLGIATAVIGDYEFVTGQVLWNPGTAETKNLSAAIRVSSLFFDPNIYGRFLMVVLLVVMGVLAWRARPLVVPVLAALFAFLFAGLLLTFSQSSLVGLLVGLLVLLALRYRLRWALLTTVLLVGVAAAAVLGLGSTLRFDVNSSEGLNRSSAGRVELVEGGLQLFEQRPVLGWGSGAYRRVYRREIVPSDQSAVAASHTTPLTVAAEQGGIGLAVYVALVIAALVALLRGAGASVARAAIAAAFVAVLVHSWFYAAFLEDPVTWVLLAAGASLASAAVRRGADGGDAPDSAAGAADDARPADASTGPRGEAPTGPAPASTPAADGG